MDHVKIREINPLILRLRKEKKKHKEQNVQI